MTNTIAHVLVASFLTVGVGGATIAARKGAKVHEPPSPLIADPRMVTAKTVRDRVVSHEVEIAERMDRVLNLLGQAKQSQRPDHSLTHTELKKLVVPLKTLARQALDEHYRLVEGTNEFVRELRHAPDGYAQAAIAWKARAGDYHHADLKQLPMGYSADCETLAHVYRERLERTEYYAKQLDELLPFLRETRMSLTDFELYLDQNPGIGAVDPVERYYGYLEMYAKAHENFREILKQYLDLLRTPIPTSLASESQP